MDIRFPGQWFQLESGLAYNWHRHYDATLGRYLQPDPLGLPALLSDGASVYGYVEGNPLSYVDPEDENQLIVTLARQAFQRTKAVWKDLNFDGPSAGLNYGNGRICQIRYKEQPIFRIDYQAIPGSEGQARLHVHVPPNMDSHFSIDPRSFWDK